MNRWSSDSSRLRCLRTMRVLQSYLDGGLDEVSARRVASHLEHCRRCGLESFVYSEIKAALRRQDQVDPRVVERLRRFGNQLAGGEEPSSDGQRI